VYYQTFCNTPTRKGNITLVGKSRKTSDRSSFEFEGYRLSAETYTANNNNGVHITLTFNRNFLTKQNNQRVTCDSNNDIIFS